MKVPRLFTFLVLASYACSREHGVEKEAFLFEGPEIGYRSPGDNLTFRSEGPGGAGLLLRGRNGENVIRYHPSLDTATPATIARWKLATGPVASERQFWVPSGDWSIAPPKLSFRNQVIRATGRHHLAYGRSLDRDYIAVVSANGRYRKSGGGFMPFLGGRPAWAGGTHFLQIFHYRTGETVGEPVRIPLRSRDGPIEANWTLDNLYVVLATWRGTLAIAASGLPARNVLGSQEGLDVFQPTEWTSPWSAGIQGRYSDAAANSLLLRHVRESVVYAYHANSQELVEADDDAWGSAVGDAWDDYDLIGFDRRGVKTLDTSEQERPSRPTEQASDHAREFARDWKDKTEGGRPEQLSVSPMLRTALVFSSDDAGRWYQERYDLPSGRAAAHPLRLPATIGEVLHVLWTPDERYVLFWDSEANLLYVQRAPADDADSAKPNDSGMSRLWTTAHGNDVR